MEAVKSPLSVIAILQEMKTNGENTQELIATSVRFYSKYS